MLARAKDAMGSLSSVLSDLGLSVSTGRVVDFRAESFLRQQPCQDTVPLIYPCHFNGHTQVNATDLRGLRYPTRHQLEHIGRSIEDPAADQEAIDRLLEQELDVKTELRQDMKEMHERDGSTEWAQGDAQLPRGLPDTYMQIVASGTGSLTVDRKRFSVAPVP